jgi:outer membrane protein OmpA-like peptidoglycan-associated protein
MRLKEWFFVLLVCMVSAYGCSRKTIVVLVPDPDGSVGAVNVANQEGSIDLASANQSTTVKGPHAAPTEARVLPENEVNKLFSDVLAVGTSPPVHFLLYFEGGSTALRPESLEMLPVIMDAIKSRNSVDISIVGHTDTAGNKAYNLLLSNNRAQAVSKLLVEKGVQYGHIKTTSHGEENPLIKTGDNVIEPRNRRVEVIVR